MTQADTEHTPPAAPLLSGKAALAAIGISEITADTDQAFSFSKAQTQAESAIFQVVIENCQKAPGLDGKIIERVAILVRGMVEEDAQEEAEVRFNRKKYERYHAIRRFLTQTPAQTLAGLQAKAILVRRYDGPSVILPTGYEDDALAWSLAGDLLGLPSAVYDGEQL